MDASGGTGTLNPPSDGDDIAKVTPLRRGNPHLAAVPRVRDPLPAETSVWDTDEPGDPPLRRSRRQRVRGALTIGWTSVRSQLTIRPLSAAPPAVLLACIAAVTAVALGTGSGRVTKAHRTVASSPVPHGSSSAKVPAPAAHPAHRPTRKETRHRAQPAIRHRAQPAIRRQRTRADARRATTGQGSARTSNATPPAASTPTTTVARPPSTPISVSDGASSTTVSSDNTSKPSRPAGPTGSGAAFGPGY
jgi:hypothetical protein